MKVYFKIQKHLGNENIEGDELMNCYLYRKATNDKQQKETRQIKLPPSRSLLAGNSDHGRLDPNLNINTDRGISDKGMQGKIEDKKSNTMEG